MCSIHLTVTQMFGAFQMALRLDWIESRRRNAALKGKTQQQLLQPLDRYETDEDLYMDLSDTLFSSLNQPFSFPNPREISRFCLITFQYEAFCTLIGLIIY